MLPAVNPLGTIVYVPTSAVLTLLIVVPPEFFIVYVAVPLTALSLPTAPATV